MNFKSNKNGNIISIYIEVHTGKINISSHDNSLKCCLKECNSNAEIYLLTKDIVPYGFETFVDPLTYLCNKHFNQLIEDLNLLK